MNKLFLTILNMSLTGAFVIGAICLARLPLKRAPKIISYCLWAVAGFRLVFPFSIESIFSLIPFRAQTIPMDIVMQPVPRIDSGISFINNAVSSILPAAKPTASVNPLQIWMAIGAWVWFVGLAVLFIYGVVSFFILKRKMREAAHIEANIYEAENIKSPFVLGVFKPKIYLPAGLSGQEKIYIILHEQTHIRRHDYIIKFVAYFILCVHWFNPLAWVAFLLMGVDMEMSCDERVLKEMGGEIKKDYLLSLLSLATERHIIGGSPLAFGEGGIKERVKNVLNFKKPSRVIIVAAVALAAVLSVGFAVNRIVNTPPFEMKMVYEENPAFFLKDMKLIWDDAIYHVTPMNNTGRGKEIGYATDEYSTWRIYELNGYDRDYLLAVESEDVWRVMSIHPPEAPSQQYILENATEKQRAERMLSVTLFNDGTARLAIPPISSYALLSPYYYTFADSELLIYYESDNIIAKFMVIDDNTLIFKEASVPLFADEGARYLSVSNTSLYELQVLTLEDVRALAKKGDSLLFEDFQKYKGANVSSNLDYYIMVYGVEGGYRLIVCSDQSGKPDSVNFEGIWEGGGSGIDIRYGDIDEFLSKRPIIMQAKEGTATPSGVTVTLKNVTETEYTYGESYTIQHKTRNGWIDAVPVIENYGFDDIGYMLPAVGSKEIMIDWEWLYGKLPAGDYRIVKEALFVRSPGDYDTFKLFAAFTIAK